VAWNYRIVKYRDGSGFGLHEVYYDEAGLPWGMTERPCGFACYADEDPRGSIIGQLKRAIRDVRLRSQEILEEPKEWPGKSPQAPEVKEHEEGKDAEATKDKR